MAMFNVLRAGRNQEEYMERLIHCMYQDGRMFYKRGNGVDDRHPQLIIDAFRAVRNTYYKTNSVEVHYIEISVEHTVASSTVVKIAEKFGSFLFRNGFQNFITVVNTEQYYVIAVAINSVSYTKGRLFWDNNTVCCEMYKYLCEIFPAEVKLHISDNVIFELDKKRENYVYGLYLTN